MTKGVEECCLFPEVYSVRSGDVVIRLSIECVFGLVASKFIYSFIIYLHKEKSTQNVSWAMFIHT